jgi:hypothetical protein
MWTYNTDYKKWFANDDSISKNDFDYLKQELKATRFYSRCLSGATYLPVNELTDIYDILGKYQQRNWYINPIGSQYSITTIPSQHASSIDSATYFDFYTKYLSEYGLTLKNLFTPYRLIKDSSKNFYYVDVATTDTIDLNLITKDYSIDGVKLKNGHRVLVKDQRVNVVLLSTADPNTYFTGNYTVVQDLGATIEYQYYSEENGVYLYKDGNLVRESDLDDYKQCIRYSVSVKLGSINANKQFHLSRLLNGYFPTVKLVQPIEFKEKHNWILRNRVDYNNLFEINYYDIIKHGTHSYNYEGFTYSIPERSISIGEFGIILNTQEGKSNIIKNKYKVNLRSITQTSKYYWICGDENTLLRIRKHDFYIDRILIENVPTTLPNLIKTNLSSVSFYNDLVGVVVGELNTILYTKNGGYKWERIEIADFIDYNYNKVLYSTNYSFYVAGDNGVLVEFVNSISGWIAYKRRVSQIEDGVDEYLLVENINDLYKTTLSNWNISYNYYTQSIPTDKELLFIVTDNSKVIAYDINNSFSEIGTDFIYFDFGQEYSDIRNITRRQGTNTFYFTGTEPVSGHDGLFSFDISNFSTLGTGSSYSNTAILNTEYQNSGPNTLNYISSNLVINLPSGTGIYNVDFDIFRGDDLVVYGDSYAILDNVTYTGTTTHYSSQLVLTNGYLELSNDNQAGDIIISNIIIKKVITTYEYNGYPNEIFDYNGDELLICGNNSLLGVSTYSTTLSFNSLDSTFEDKLKSKLLVIDYDIASKLNFFTDAGEYRLPNSVTFSNSTLDSLNSKIGFKPIEHLQTSTNNGTYSETNWITYWTDAQKTFEYYSFTPMDETTKVLISTTFSYDSTNSASLSYNNTQITASSSLISLLAPAITMKNLVKIVSIKTAGTGYTTGTNITTTGGSGTGLTVNIIASGGIITSVTINKKGSGYKVGDVVTISGGTNGKIKIDAIEDFSQSRYNGYGLPSISAVPTTGAASVFRIFIYEYLMVYKVPLTYAVSVGDVIKFESGVVDTELVVNKVKTIGSWKFIYMYTEFNQNIINDLQLTSGSITLTNLNKYTTVDQLKNRFNNHPVSNAYKLDYLDNYGNVTTSATDVFQLSARFNNLTSYYNLQTSIDVSANSLITASVSNYLFSGGVSSSTSYLTSTYSFMGGISASNIKLAGVSYGYSGDGSPAIGARLSQPIGVAFYQNTMSYYIADNENNVIRVVDAGGIIQTEVGVFTPTPNYSGDGGPYQFCELYMPSDVAFDDNNCMYIATNCPSSDYYHVIRKVDYNTGLIDVFAGVPGNIGAFSGDTGPAIAAELDRPSALVYNPNDKCLYFSDSGNNRIRYIDTTTGIIDTYAGNGAPAYAGDGGLAISARINNPGALSIDNIGNLYIADTDNYVVRVVDYSTKRIDTVAGSNIFGYAGDGGLAVSAKLGYVTGVVYDNNTDCLYVVSNDNIAVSTIRKVDTASSVGTGKISTIVVSTTSNFLNRVILAENGQDLVYSGELYKVIRRTFESSASLSGTLTSIPNNNDIVKLRLDGVTYTYTFKTTASLAGEVQIGGSISACLLNLQTAISITSGMYSYILSVSAIGNYITIIALDTFGAIPNNSISWNLEPKISTFITDKCASLSAQMGVIPTDGDTATLNLAGNITTYTFKTVANNPNEIQISTLSNTLDSLLLSITSSYSPYLSMTSSVVSGDTINLISKLSYGSTPNSNSNWKLSYSLSVGGNFITTMYDMLYTNSFLKFGYSPTYNLLDYLTSINDVNDVNPKFYATKEYLVMPHYEGLPLGSLTASGVYIDYNGMTASLDLNSQGNKIIFGSSLKLEWESIFINTFINVVIHGTSDYTTERLLVMDKYYDIVNDYYVIEFHKRLNFNLGDAVIGNGGTLDIISRRHLSEISDDLQELNNIQRTKGKSNSWQDQGVYTYETYENELNFKIPTDSYAKILLSDDDTIQTLSAVIYVDYKNELAMNITRLDKEYNIPISNTLNYSNKLYISCSKKHDLTTGEGVVLEFTGGDGSSEVLNPQYSGYHVITKINEYDFLTDMDYGQVPTVGIDSGYVKYTKKDPFLNYQPVDLIDLGVDGKGKISLELSIENLKLSNSVYSLTDVDFEKYRFRLIDGLNIETVNLKYAWLLEAELSGALIGLNNDDTLVWYKGTWIFGRWFGGTWQSGVWMSGDWYGGTWNSNIVTDNILTANVDTKTVDLEQSFWYTGRWYDGTWNAGIWNGGRWYGGTWNSGMWHKGTWNDGTWNSGNFEGGIWVLGTWNNGIFNCDNEPAYWLDGKWYGGDFENGMWYNGYWEQKNSSSRFGTKSFNSRTANWQAGTWVSGSFFSYLNTNDQGVLDVSDVHKYSIWKTGQWLSGEWYGGIAYNMDFKTGTWYGGILEDIEVIGIDTTNNTFTLNGIFKFNIGDTIYIIDNQIDNANSVYGSNLNPGVYKVLYQTEDSTNKRTTLYVNSNLNGPSVTTVLTDTGLRVVSKFKNLNWKSGIWTNGIYDDGLWEGGIWYNGVFSGIWS